jgi:long-chain acyl-CoA synthetase
MMNTDQEDDRDMYQTIPQMFDEIVQKYPDMGAQMSKDAKGAFHTTTYRQLQCQVRALAASLDSLGLRRGENVGLISDNRAQWLVADLAVLSLGAVDVPRGRDAMPYEVSFILGFTECRFCFAENLEQLQKILELKEGLPALRHLIVMDDSSVCDIVALERLYGVSIHRFSKLLDAGGKLLGDALTAEKLQHRLLEGTAEETATLIFTSGTTGDPKGVMLCHRNFIHQLNQLPEIVEFKPGQRWLSVLPVWHSFERILQYLILSQASTIAYSKPIGKILLTDLQRVNPSFMGSVPRIWETVKAGVYQSIKAQGKAKQRLFDVFVGIATARAKYRDMFHGHLATFRRRSRIVDLLRSLLPLAVLTPLWHLGDMLAFRQIKAKLGSNFIAGVSGGGSLSEPVDTFFKAIGVSLLDGYGLTESAPVVAVRTYCRQVSGTVHPLGGTEIKIVDEQGRPLAPGKKGVVMVRGPQVMQGYYRRPDLTGRVIDKDGWLDTGDLGMWTHDGDFSICGRAKDTIVLSGGENLEPVPIEARLCESEYIEQAVVVGQDRKYLGALIVLASKMVERYLKEHQVPYINREHLEEIPEVKALVNREIQNAVSSKHGFKSFEQVNRFVILDHSFEVGKELSAKQEVKRHRIQELYKDEITSMYA